MCWLAPTPYIFAWFPGRNAGLLLLFVQEISKIQHLMDNMEYCYKYLLPYTYARVCLHVIVHVRVRISTYGIQYIYIYIYIYIHTDSIVSAIYVSEYVYTSCSLVILEWYSSTVHQNDSVVWWNKLLKSHLHQVRHSRQTNF